MKKVLIAGLLVAVLVSLTAHLSLAQGYPTKRVQIVLPYAAGGGADLMTRMVATRLSERWKQPVTVENKPGAGGTIGNDIVAKSPADGYTLLMAAAGLAVSPWIYKTLPYDTEKDLVPITIVGSLPYIVVVNKNVPAKTLPELFSYARANPGKLNFGSPGVGTLQQLAQIILKHQSGINALEVPYNGSQPALVATVAGAVDLVIDTPAAVSEFVKQGAIRALAVTGRERTPDYPDLPTVAETLPGYDISSWEAMLAPAGTPESIVQFVQNSIAETMREPEMNANLRRIGFTPYGSTSAELKTFLSAEIKKFGEAAKAANIKPE